MNKLKNIISKCFGISILLFITSPLCSQELNNSLLHKWDSLPRIKEDYDKEGHYGVAVILDKSELNKGDELNVYVFLTGYGEIGPSKIAVYTSTSNIFDSSSLMFTGLGKDTVRKFYYWGRDSSLNSSELWVISFTGGQKFIINGQIRWDSYLDATIDDRNLLIISEMLLGKKSPVTFKFKIKKNAAAGKYRISFDYTYFNGIKWDGSTTVVEFKINNFAEQYATQLTIIGIGIGFLGLLPLFKLSFSHVIDFIKGIRKIILSK